MKMLEILRAKLAELNETRAAHMAEMEAITEIVATESRSALTEDEGTAHGALVAAVETLDEARGSTEAEITRLEAIEARTAVAEQVQRETGRTPAHIGKRDPFDLSDVRMGFTSKDELRSRAMAGLDKIDTISAEEKEQVEGLIRRSDSKHGSLAHRVLVTGSESYRSAFGKVMEGNEYGLTGAERSSLAEMRAASLTDAAGGYAVPVTLDPSIISVAAGSQNPFRQISSIKTTVTDTWSGVSLAAISASWDAEAAEVSDDTPTMGQPVITPHKLQMFVPFSIEVGMDWASMESDLREGMAMAKDDAEAAAFAVGTGSGQPKGIITAIGGTASAVDTASTGAYVIGDIYSLDNALANKYRNNAKFVADRTIYNLTRQFDTGGGAGLWTQLGGGRPSELIGYQAHESSSFDSTVAAGKEFLLLGDFRYYNIVDRIGMTVDLVPHLFGANNRPTGQRGIYAYSRVGADCVNIDAFRLLTSKAA